MVQIAQQLEDQNFVRHFSDFHQDHLYTQKYLLQEAKLFPLLWVWVWVWVWVWAWAWVWVSELLLVSVSVLLLVLVSVSAS
jgi:hypothetical protein